MTTGARRRGFAALLAAATAAACARGRPEARLGTEPAVRIGLAVGRAAAVIGAQGAAAVVAGAEPVSRLGPGDSVTLVPDGRAVVARGRGLNGRFESLTFVGLTEARFLTVDGRPYRGTVEVFARPAGLTVVNRLPLESYLQGVVSAEMGRRAPQDAAALRAQAVVSRTYALANRGRHGAEGFDLAATVADQVYGGVATEAPEGIDAVRSTAGQVVTDHGALIAPFFHSTCGYSTASPDEVFRTVARASYLTPVSDRRPGGYYCDISPRFRWKVEWDGAGLRDILRRTVPATIGVPAERLDDVQDVHVRHTGRSGRATEVRIRVGRGEIPVFGPDLRGVFVTPAGQPLGSTAFQLHRDRDGDRLVGLVAAGAGWGHGVGMCQWGAVGRARAGQDYRTILATYFRGTAIERWY